MYDAHRFLITSVDLPVVAQVMEASPEIGTAGSRGHQIARAIDWKKGTRPLRVDDLAAHAQIAPRPSITTSGRSAL